jgi:hypothetical protein
MEGGAAGAEAFTSWPPSWPPITSSIDDVIGVTASPPLGEMTLVMT